MKKIIIILLSFFYFSIVYAFHIAPTFFEKRIDGSGGYQEFFLYNDTLNTQRYKIQFYEGSGKFNGNSNSWTEYSPKIVTVKPKSKSMVKVFMKAPKETSEGEYSTYINFKTIPVPELRDEKNGLIQAANKLMLDISLEIVGYVGDLKPNLEITNLKLLNNQNNKEQIEFKITNKTLKRGVYMSARVIEDSGNFESFEIGRIGANSEKDFAITLNKTKKSNIIEIQIIETSTGNELIKKSI